MHKNTVSTGRFKKKKNWNIWVNIVWTSSSLWSQTHILAGKAISNVPDKGSYQERTSAPMWFPIIPVNVQQSVREQMQDWLTWRLKGRALTKWQTVHSYWPQRSNKQCYTVCQIHCGIVTKLHSTQVDHIKTLITVENFIAISVKITAISFFPYI